MKNMLFQSLHSAPGANASFALGYRNHGGGFGIEIDRVPDQDVYIGVRKNGTITCFPFFKDTSRSAEKAFTQKEDSGRFGLAVFPEELIDRKFRYGTDKFESGCVSFEVISPVRMLPDPDLENYDTCKYAYCPGIIARMTVDNRTGTEDAEAVFAVSPMEGKQALSRLTGGMLKGFTSRTGYGFAVEGTAEMTEFSDFGLSKAYGRTKKVISHIAPLAGISVLVHAGEKKEMILALGWYKKGIATDGLRTCRYYYTNYYPDLVSVLAYVLDHQKEMIADGEKADKLLEQKELSQERKLLLCQSVKSYYYSTMLLDDAGKPRWVTNEGAFRMMNTLDLAIDHAFFELYYQPWSVRNQLEGFLEDYSYYDQCGISFTHDQGTHNVFTAKGTSSYELPDLTDCFSFMSQEQLCNWILLAALYVENTGDIKWAEEHAAAIGECLKSMKNRDSMEDNYNGIMSVDSSCCCTGSEITTYDSLDSSLGQASESLYLAVKCWASYLALGKLSSHAKLEEVAAEAECHAVITARTIVSFYREDLGFIPAILNGTDASPIIPAIEGVIYPYLFGRKDVLAETGRYGELIKILKKHTETVLQVGVCLFPDKGWKLSAGSENSWMSKIFLCEYIAQDLLECEFDYDTSDAAHWSWWADGCPSNPGIDQIIRGTQEEQNFHYPRAVTSYLWIQD